MINVASKILNKYSKSYLNHLLKSDEMLASMLISLHNIYFYQQFMREIRRNINEGTFNFFIKKYINFLINHLNLLELICKRWFLRALSSVGRAPPF